MVDIIAQNRWCITVRAGWEREKRKKPGSKILKKALQKFAVLVQDPHVVLLEPRPNEMVVVYLNAPSSNMIQQSI